MNMLGNLPSGEVVVDRHYSYFHPSVADILPELFDKITSGKRPFISEEIEMGRIIGESICVETTDSDEIVYAHRAKRKGCTRFVKNRKPIPSSKAVVILKWDEDTKVYILITAFVGSKSEPEPWDRNATPNSRPFWDTHALIMDGSYEITPARKQPFALGSPSKKTYKSQ